MSGFKTLHPRFQKKAGHVEGVSKKHQIGKGLLRLKLVYDTTTQKRKRVGGRGGI